MNPRHDASEHREEATDRYRGPAVERERAPPLPNHLTGRRPARIDAPRISARIGPRLRRETVAMQLDEPSLRARFPRCDFHLVEEVPLHRLGPPQPAGPAVPDVWG